MADIIPLIAEYQDLLRAEKAALLCLPKAREAAMDLLEELQRPTKQRRISALQLTMLMAQLDRHLDTPEADVAALTALKLNLEQWNLLRVAGEKTPLADRVKWDGAFTEMALKRNDVIEQVLFLTGYIRRQVAPDRTDIAGDLESYGVVGIIRAMDLYSPAFGGSFENYARIWITASMTNFLRRDHVVYMTDSASRVLSGYRKAMAALEGELGRPPTDEEVAVRLGVKIGRVDEIAGMQTSVVSMDAEANEGEGDGEDDEGLHSILAAEGCDPSEGADSVEIRNALERLFDGLTQYQKTVVRLRGFPAGITIVGPVIRPLSESLSMIVAARLARMSGSGQD